MIYRGQSESGKYDCYYLLLRVENTGKARAEQVEVFLSKIAKEDTGGNWVPVNSFLPQRLLWSFSQGAHLPSLSPGMHSHCNLGHILPPWGRSHVQGENPNALDFWGKPVVPDDKTVLCLDVQFRSNNLSHFLIPGKYRLDLLLGSSQTKAVPFQITLDLSGKWFESEKDMFQEGVTLQVKSRAW